MQFPRCQIWKPYDDGPCAKKKNHVYKTRRSFIFPALTLLSNILLGKSEEVRNLKNSKIKLDALTPFMKIQLIFTTLKTCQTVQYISSPTHDRSSASELIITC
jgi:hypothetical protein